MQKRDLTDEMAQEGLDDESPRRGQGRAERAFDVLLPNGPRACVSVRDDICSADVTALLMGTCMVADRHAGREATARLVGVICDGLRCTTAPRNAPAGAPGGRSSPPAICPKRGSMGTMDEASLYRLLDDSWPVSVSPDDVVRRLRRLPYADLGFARVDHHRALRQGLPEAVYGPGKSVAQCVAIVGELLAEPDGGPVVLPGRTMNRRRQHSKPTREASARARPSSGARRRPAAGAGGGFCGRHRRPRRGRGVHGHLGRARLSAPAVSRLRRGRGAPASRARRPAASADAVVVIAGMEGALASLVGGLTPAPVVAVPTSAGYGASLEGVTALLAMLASCAPGICVVGIDNGFGAAWAVARILGGRQADGPTSTIVPGTPARTRVRA